MIVTSGGSFLRLRVTLPPDVVDVKIQGRNQGSYEEFKRKFSKRFATFWSPCVFGWIPSVWKSTSPLHGEPACPLHQIRRRLGRILSDILERAVAVYAIGEELLCPIDCDRGIERAYID